MSDQTKAAIKRSPRQRWGTCCPFDPECDHSFIDDRALGLWLDTPISDERAAVVESDLGEPFGNGSDREPPA